MTIHNWKPYQSIPKPQYMIKVPNLKEIKGEVIDVGTLKPIADLKPDDIDAIAKQHADYLNKLPLQVQKKLKQLLFFISFVGFFLMPLMSFDTMSTRGYILANTPHNVSIYLNKVWNDAETVSKSHGIPLALVLAQSCLESGFGKSNFAVNNCNHHGIKYCGKYAEFSCKLESFVAYANVLTQPCYGTPKDLQEWFTALECCKYAESKVYVQKLKTIIKKYNLYLL